MSQTATTGGVLPTGRGVRRFALGALTNSAGIGFFYSFALLYYHATSRLGIATIGAVLTAANLAVLPLVPAVGRLADRAGPKTMLVAAALVRAGAFAGYETTHGLVPFALITMAAALGTRVEQLAAPMLCAAAPADGAGKWLALYRAAFNGGVGGGALLASLLVTRTGYGMLGVLTAACFLTAAALYTTLPASTPASAEPAVRPLPAWQDTRFVRVAVVNGVLWLVALALELGLPVYLVQVLALPAWTVGLFFGVNTVALMSMQLPVNGWLERFPPASALAAGNVLYVAASAVLALAIPLGRGMRLSAVLAVVIVWTAGELVVGQCAIVLVTRLAPPDRRGGYLAFNQVLVGVATAFAPLLVTTALAVHPPLLWWGTAALVVVATALVPARGAAGTPPSPRDAGPVEHEVPSP